MSSNFDPEMIAEVRKKIDEVLDDQDVILGLTVISAALIRTAVVLSKGDVEEARFNVIRTLDKGFELYGEALAAKEKEPDAGC